ncbi:tetratricopeptide repeat protein [Streptomyces shenzhenensis]|uniref:tetratricopeptide repeat protein n=1 Tax=Streptomyces shenzhenensis TaxID=943815 RepID=UPI00286803C2|nr:tetratricopeptide repeat protein [Streptomyces shenzhenensis]
MHYVAGAIAAAPQDPEPYAVLAELWEKQREDLAELLQGANSLRTVLARSYISFLQDDMDGAAMAIGAVTGVQPTVAWANAPWFGDARFVGTVSANALAEAAMRTMDYGHALDIRSTREGLRPWFDAIDAVCAREPVPEAMAKMAIFLRACGLTDASFSLCDRADSVERIMLTEVVRAGTWRKLGDPGQTAAAFERALALDPTNWSLYLDLADLRAEQGDFTAAVQFIGQGLEHEPTEVTLRAAGAAYGARLTGSPDDLRELIALAPHLPNDPYRALLIDHACSGPALPGDLIAEARRFQNT